MIHVRKRNDVGQTHIDWLESYHSFSFGEYHDPDHMGFRALRVINDDIIAPGGGFGMHGHRDMEIVTYMLDGALAHRDSLGNGDVMQADDVQAMSAGRGIRHSEANASPDQPAHLLQIWLFPDRAGHEPRYQQRRVPREEKQNRLRLIASGDPSDDSLHIHQDARIYATVLAGGNEVQHALARGRHAWVQVARGDVTVNGQPLAAGDGAALVDEPNVRLASSAGGELLLFDLA
jgi:redox-sensitive bicupin YhaK (pirin superfamily)